MEITFKNNLDKLKNDFIIALFANIYEQDVNSNVNNFNSLIENRLMKVKEIYEYDL